MGKLKPCHLCGGRGKKTIDRRFGVPSGDLGYQATVQCIKCGHTEISWALCKSWVDESIVKKWNRRMSDETVQRN